MSSTSNVQNLFVNVFRPVYTYDPTTLNFTPKIEVSNVDILSGNSVSVFTAAIGDSGSNMYVGSNAGNTYTAIRGCSNTVALGVGAGNLISNVSNSVFLGFNAGAGVISANNNIVIGANTNGNGSSNIVIGTSSGTVGSSNIFIGQAIAPGNVSNQLRIGVSNTMTLTGNLSNQWVGIGGTTAPVDSMDKLDVSGNTYIYGNLGINTVPGSRTLDVNGNFRADDTIGTLDFSNGVTRATNGYVSIQSNVSAAVGSTTIGTIKKGIIHVSTVDQASSANRAAYIYFAWTTSNVTALASSSNGDTDIATSSTNIQISNASSTKTYDYSITYFPLP
jgi:hypothetical protein